MMWLLYEVNRGRKGKKMTPSDFLPGWWDVARKRPSPQRLKEKVVALNLALGGQDLRPLEKR